MLKLDKPVADYAEQITEYRTEFTVERKRATYDPDRIPGIIDNEETPFDVGVV